MMRALLIGGILAVGAVLAGATGASAHGGPYELQVASDGAGGIDVIAEYTADGHLVEEIMDPVATATSSDGRVAGPVELVSSAEGVGRWVSEATFLDEGVWTVTVETTTPTAASATVEFEVAPLAAPISAEEETTADAAGASSPPLTAWLWIVGGVGLVAVVVVALVARQRRAG